MVANTSFNPMLTTNGAGLFNTQSQGWIQGTALNDPAARYALAGGYLLSTETIPMWGGVGIFEDVPLNDAGSPQGALGGGVGRATALTGSTALTGFSVFDQAHAMINTPQSPVPLANSLMAVNFYRLKSGARIAVKAAASLTSAADGGIITQQVSWDFVNQQLIPYAPAFAAATITGATWASTGGGQTSYVVTTDLQAVLNAGDVITVSGIVQTGAVGTGFNGSKVVVSVPDATHVVVIELGAVAPATYSSAGSIAAGGGALDVRVLRVSDTNCKVVNYDPVTGYATWANNAPAAIILL